MMFCRIQDPESGMAPPLLPPTVEKQLGPFNEQRAFETTSCHLPKDLECKREVDIDGDVLSFRRVRMKRPSASRSRCKVYEWRKAWYYRGTSICHGFPYKIDTSVSYKLILHF